MDGAGTSPGPSQPGGSGTEQHSSLAEATALGHLQPRRGTDSLPEQRGHTAGLGDLPLPFNKLPRRVHAP